MQLLWLIHSLVSSQTVGDDTSLLKVGPVELEPRLLSIVQISTPVLSVAVVLVVLARFRVLLLRAEWFLRGGSRNLSSILCVPRSAAAEDADRLPPTALWVLASLMHCGCNIMFSISMPTAHAVSTLAGTSLGASGWIIGAYAMGALPCMPLCYFVELRHVRSCFLVHAGLAAASGALQVVALSQDGWGSLFASVIVIRCLQGASAAVNYTGSLALTRACGSRTRTQYIFYWAGGGSVGLALGPALSSLGELLVQASRFSAPHLVGPPAVVCAYGLLLAATICLVCPSDASLREQLPQSAVKGGESKCSRHPGTRMLSHLLHAEAALGAVMIVFGPALRTMIRVTWEAMSLLVLEQQGVDRVQSGLLVSSVAAWNAVAMITFGESLRIMRSRFGMIITDYFLLTLLDSLCLCGLAIIDHSSFFLLGSTILYCANSLSGSPFMSFCMSLSRQSPTPLFSDKGLLLINHCSALCMFCMAPVCSRHISEFGAIDASLLATLLLPWLLGQITMNIASMYQNQPLVV